MKKIILSLLAVVSMAFATDSGVVSGSADGTTEVCLGYTPRLVSIVNETDNTMDVQVYGMDDNKTILTTGSTGVISYPTGTNIVRGSVTDASSVKCYGFQFTATSGDALIYNADR